MTVQYVAIHQPNFIPWIGYFDKLFKSDIFVILDDVDFTKGQYFNRNKVISKTGETLLTVPVKGNHLRMKDVKIDYSRPWRRKHLETLYSSYKRAPHFETHFKNLVEIYDNSHETLLTFNMEIIKYVARILGIDTNTRICYSSEITDANGKSQRLIEICAALGSEAYVYGEGSTYLQHDLFRRVGISTIPQRFTHPVYPQNYNGQFVANLSMIDWVLMDNIDRIKDSLLESKNEWLKEVHRDEQNSKHEASIICI